MVNHPGSSLMVTPLYLWYQVSRVLPLGTCIYSLNGIKAGLGKVSPVISLSSSDSKSFRVRRGQTPTTPCGVNVPTPRHIDLHAASGGGYPRGQTLSNSSCAMTRGRLGNSVYRDGARAIGISPMPLQPLAGLSDQIKPCIFATTITEWAAAWTSRQPYPL